MWLLDPTTEAPAPGYGPWRKTCPWQAAMDVASHRDEITFILDGWGVTYISHSIYGTGIFTYIYHKIQPNVNVGKYTIPMASMGIQCQHIVLKRQIYKSNHFSFPILQYLLHWHRSIRGQTYKYCPIAIPAGLLRTRILGNCFNLGSQKIWRFNVKGRQQRGFLESNHASDLGEDLCNWLFRLL